MKCDRNGCDLEKVVPARNIRQVIFVGNRACVFADTAAKAGCARPDCAQDVQYAETQSDFQVEWLLDNVSAERTSSVDA